MNREKLVQKLFNQAVRFYNDPEKKVYLVITTKEEKELLEDVLEGAYARRVKKPDLATDEIFGYRVIDLSDGDAHDCSCGH